MKLYSRFRLPFLMLALVFLSSCKKENKSTVEEVPVVTPQPEFTTFSPTIAICDYTTSTPSNPTMTSQFTVNLSPSIIAMAYVFADGVKYDSLQLTITYRTDIAPKTVSYPTDWFDADQWPTYVHNTKAFKVKNGAKNVFYIYEAGKKVALWPIQFYSYDNHNQFDTYYQPKDSTITQSYPTYYNANAPRNKLVIIH